MENQLYKMLFTQNKRKNRVPIKLFNYLVYFLIICFFATSCKNKPKNAVEAALIEQNWQKVYDACKKDDPLLKQPETIGILGNAAIMLNKGNVSFILLTSIDIDSIKRKGWQSWTDSFALGHPDQAIANYLQGDACMRNGNKEKALECFNKAIEIDPEFALAYNARGVLYTINKDKAHNLDDFNIACKLNPQIADFFVNRGTMYYNNKNPETSINDFEKATNISPNNALALNGKACSKCFDYHKSSVKENELDTILYYLYNAKNQLNLLLINENIRTLMLEYENKVLPDQIESPYFKLSDFLSWSNLQQLSVNYKYDALKFLLKDTLPIDFNKDILIKINSLLSKPDLFAEYLKQKNVSDSLKSVVANVKNISVVTGKSKEEQIVCFNRLIFERIYNGLIASYRNRKPGTTIGASFWKQKSMQYQGEMTTASHMMDLAALIGYKGDLVHAAYIAALGTGFGIGAHAGQMYSDYMQTVQNSPRPFQNNTTIPTPGGALADIRRVYKDNDKPYPLVCINTLCYDPK